VLVLGLEVPHAHIHLVPIGKESDIIISKPKQNLSNEEFTAIAKAINKAWISLSSIPF
jgi:histidine triad (HIT) family protein